MTTSCFSLLSKSSSTSYFLSLVGSPLNAIFNLVERRPFYESPCYRGVDWECWSSAKVTHRCRHPSGNWLCLCCKEVLCSRFVNKHMLQHFRQTSHCLTLGFSDLSVWCFSCNSYIKPQVVPQLQPVYEAAYILKFGELPPIRNVTASSKGEDEFLNIAVSGRVEARTWCGHLASLSSDLLHIPSPDTCCNRLVYVLDQTPTFDCPNYSVTCLVSLMH
ncbi:hypothetical protein ACJRO7_027341 [Eucalyptus globulus]|uniref:UBP-type domain-containing protein n=1 Tax=Eucalyptus globulus TaxID=34317 RepID=A0ABD3JVV6_EUCGL